MTDPASAILGTTLLAAAQAKWKTEKALLPLGCSTIERALQSGIRYGEITSIAGASGTGKTLIALHAAASQLIAHPTNEVALIDTTGSFSPVRLLEVIVLRLNDVPSTPVNYQHSGYVYSKIPDKAKTESLQYSRERAARMLDRVKVMRVFDFAGVIEAIGEVGTLCEETEREKLARAEEGTKVQPELNEIASSQLDDNVGIDDDENNTSPPQSTVQHAGIGMIIIDNIANPVSAVMSQNQTEAQALLTTSFRSLRLLTMTHDLCTIVVNAAVGLASSHYPRRPEENVSIFASTKGKPALGKTYAYLVDTSIFLSQVPKTRKDAETAYGQGQGDKRQWQDVGIFEVLKDRLGAREGRWGAFEMRDGLGLRGYEG